MGTILDIILGAILVLAIGVLAFSLMEWIFVPFTLSNIAKEQEKQTKQIKRLADNVAELTKVLKEINHNSTDAS